MVLNRMKRKSNKTKKTNKAKNVQKGGYGAGATPVGQPWQGDNPETWPGVAAANGTHMHGMTSSNHLPLSPNGIAVGGVKIAEPGVPLELKKTMTGGARKQRGKSRKQHGEKMNRTNRANRARANANRANRANRTKKRVYKMKGGFLGPQDLLNFGHKIRFNVANIFDNFMGNQHSTNPSVLDQPINEMPARVISPTPINIARSINKADI